MGHIEAPHDLDSCDESVAAALSLQHGLASLYRRASAGHGVLGKLRRLQQEQGR